MLMKIFIKSHKSRLPFLYSGIHYYTILYDIVCYLAVIICARRYVLCKINTSNFFLLHYESVPFQFNFHNCIAIIKFCIFNHTKIINWFTIIARIFDECSNLSSKKKSRFITKCPDKKWRFNAEHTWRFVFLTRVSSNEFVEFKAHWIKMSIQQKKIHDIREYCPFKTSKNKKC